jgi:hypothetical protein
MSQVRNQREAHSKESFFFLGGHFSPEDGGDMFLRKYVDFHQIVWSYVPKDITLQKFSCSLSLLMTVIGV